MHFLSPNCGPLAQDLAHVTQGGAGNAPRTNIILKIAERFLKNVQTRVEFSQSIGAPGQLLRIQCLFQIIVSSTHSLKLVPNSAETIFAIIGSSPRAALEIVDLGTERIQCVALGVPSGGRRERPLCRRLKSSQRQREDKATKQRGGRSD